MRRILICISFLLNLAATAQVVTETFQLASLPDSPTQPTALPLVQGQQLYGVTACYRQGNIGSFFRTDTTTTQPQELAYLRYEDGAPPYGQLIAGSDGRCYGTAFEGGLNNGGTLFACETDGTGFSVLHHFSGPDGRNPQGKLVSSTGGWLYGTAREGGQHGMGTLFRIRENGTDFAVLHHFTTTLGTPAEGLVHLATGELIGLCLAGGLQNLGGVWKSSASETATPQFLHEYFADTGYGTTPSLYLSADGYLYCTVESGGSFNRGALFRLHTTSGNREEIYNFPSSNGPRQPVGPVAEDSSGQIIGLTKQGPSGGSGVIYRINKAGDGFQSLYSATSPYSFKFATGLQAGADGAIYSALNSGGILSGGCYLMMPANFSGVTEVTSFRDDSTDVQQATYMRRKPGGGWLGLSLNGGINGGGTLFEFGTSLADRKILIDFQTGGCSNPSGPLLLAQDGNFYGLLQSGGPNGKGVLYRLKPDLHGYEIIHAFGAGNEWYPRGQLFEISEGILLGACPADGPARPGVIFKVEVTGNNYAVLRSFATPEDGSSPALLYHSTENQNLIGVCTSGGTHGKGTVFQIAIDGTSFVKLHDFQGTDGSAPNPSAYLAKSGTLYGTTALGGLDEAGTIFVVNPVNGNVSLITQLATTGVSRPVGIQFEDELGYLYGGAVLGGLGNRGGIFRVKPDGANAGLVQVDYYGQNLDSIQGMVLDEISRLVIGTRFNGFASAGSLFTLKLQPYLQTQPVEDSVILRWLDMDRHYTLETTGSLPANWQPHHTPVTTVSGTNSIVVGTEAGALYFRLKATTPSP